MGFCRLTALWCISNGNTDCLPPEAGAVNSQSRPQSHSSGEFSLLHEHEAWSSSSSSPIQYLKGHTRSSPVLQHRTPESCGKHTKTGSPGSEVVTLQQFLEESNKRNSSEVSLRVFHPTGLHLGLRISARHSEQSSL